MKVDIFRCCIENFWLVGDINFAFQYSARRFICVPANYPDDRPGEKKKVYSSMKGNHISQSLVTEGSLLRRELYRRGFCVYVGITGFISLLLLQEELKDICYVCCADCCVSIKSTVISIRRVGSGHKEYVKVFLILFLFFFFLAFVAMVTVGACLSRYTPAHALT